MVKQNIEKHFNRLTKKQRIVANYVLHHPSFVSTHAAKEVGERIGTSETTVLRFCTEIGLEGYAHLQKELTMYLFEQSSSASTLGKYLSQGLQAQPTDNLWQKTIQKDIERMEKMAQFISAEKFSEATRKLHEAKNIYIIGTDASKYAASWLAFILNLIRPNVFEMPLETHAKIRTLQKMDEKSLVIIISQHRYAKETLQMAEWLQGQNIDMLGITDSNVAPLHEFVPFTFVLEQVEQSTIDLMPLLTIFLNALVSGMTTHDPAYYEARKINFDKIEQQFILNKWS